MGKGLIIESLENESEEDDVVKPVVINGAVLSQKVLSTLHCMQADNNAYIHEIREHILKSISHSLVAMDYLSATDAAEMMEDIRYMNKFLKCLDSLAV